MIECPDLDYSQLRAPGVKLAVRCESVDEAKCLIESIKRDFPDKAKNWSVQSPCWSNDNNGRDGGRMYFPHLNNCGGFNNLVYGSRRYAVENGYQILSFKSLVMTEDLTAESNMTLESLLGL